MKDGQELRVYTSQELALKDEDFAPGGKLQFPSEKLKRELSEIIDSWFNEDSQK